MLRNIVISVLLFTLCLNIHAQYRKFKKLTSSDGISQSEVYSFLEDSRGFMWFGTIDGLNKYDGYNIEIYNTKKNDPHSLTSNTIRALAEDQFGNIWIGTDDGLNLYDIKKELIYSVPINCSNDKNSIWSLCVLDGYLMIGCSNGLLRMKIEQNKENIHFEIIEIDDLKNKLGKDNLIKVIRKSKSGGVWILASNFISRIFFENNEYVIVENLEFKNGSLNHMVEDLAGNLWISSENDGVLRYNTKSKLLDSFKKNGTLFAPSSDKCSALELDKDGNLWIGTLDCGLNFVNSNELNEQILHFESIQHYPLDSDGINSNLIYSLYASMNNQLWVGTIGSGINIFDRNQKEFKHYKVQQLNKDLLNSNFIRSVYADSNNRIWAGSHANGLVLIDRENSNFQHIGFGTQAIFFIAKYDKNKKIICSSSGIYLVEFTNNKLNIISSYVCGPVFYVESSNGDTYWCATLSGLVRFTITNNQIKSSQIYTSHTTPKISSNNCRVLFYNKGNNSLYVGTEGGGLNIVTLSSEHYPQRIDIYTSDKSNVSLSNNYVRTIIQDVNHNIWVGTYNGLNKIINNSKNGKITFKTYTQEDGLPNNMIQFAVEDDSYNIWIGTNRGLSKFAPQKEIFTNYTEEDGLQSNEFSEHTAYRTQDGEIIIGGINGVNAFYPDCIKPSLVKSRTVITDFFLFNERVLPQKEADGRVVLSESILSTNRIILSPAQNNIGFKFSSMVFPNTSKVKYAYKLEGFEEDWRYVDGVNRVVNYTNLKHGKYVFMVKSTNSDGEWSNSLAKVEITIKTPFIFTWYAKLLFVAIIAILIMLIIRQIINRKKRLLEKKHQDKLYQLDNLRMKLFINISHDLRTPLTLIREPLETILKSYNLNNEIKDMLLLVKRNVKRLNYLVEQLLDVRKAESGTLKVNLKKRDIVAFTKAEISHFEYAIFQKGLKLIVNCIFERLLVSFDSDMLSKIYFNTISNSIKYTNQGRIEVKIEKILRAIDSTDNALPKSYIKIEICDTGIGMNAEQCDKIFDRFYQVEEQIGKGYGIGLSHTKQLVEAHKGYIEVESEKDAGTTISIYLPTIIEYSNSDKITNDANEDIYIDQELELAITTDEPRNKDKIILIVEDNADMRSFIKSELKAEYNVIDACDGVDGLMKIREFLPNLIISDVIMPNMDGIELCEKVRADIEICHIPFILLTAKVDIETKYEGIKLGADDYIPKPFDMEYLSIRIKNLLDSRDVLRSLFQKKVVVEPSEVTITSLDEKFLQLVISSIDDGISDSEFSINTLESIVAMSHTHFYRKIKSLTGQSGQELLLNMRMKRAYKILSENRNIRVSEVAYMVGFTNPKYFSKCFKEFWNITPTDVSIVSQ